MQGGSGGAGEGPRGGRPPSLGDREGALARRLRAPRGELIPARLQRIAAGPLEVAERRLGHLGAPALDPVPDRWASDEGVDGGPLAGSNQAALRRANVAGLAENPFAGALVVLEHRCVPRKLEEVADRLQHPRWVGHEVLVADLAVPAELGRLAAREGEPLRPPRRDLAGFARPPPERGNRHRDVAPVAYEVNETRFGQHRLDGHHAVEIDGGLVPPALLAGSLGVEEIERPQELAGPRGAQPGHPAMEVPGGNSEVLPAGALQDRSLGLGERVATGSEGGDHLAEEVRLGWNGH